MIATLLDLNVILSAMIFIAAVVVFSLLSYLLARRLLRAQAGEDTRELAGSVLFRIAALHGLVLALVFAQELNGIRDVQVAAAHEASMLSDIYHDLERYDTETTAEIRRDLARYAVLVAQEEWQMLASDKRLSPEAWGAWERAYEGLLVLEPQDLRQERLLDFMLESVRVLSELRDARENAAQTGASALFLFAAISGIGLIAAGYFTWAPTPINLTLIASFAAYTGLIVYFIIAYANPYHAPGNATPLGFERFLTDEVRAQAGER